MIKHFCDQTGQEITGAIYKANMFFNDNDTRPTPEEQQIMIDINNLSFGSIQAMAQYFITHSIGGDA